MATTKKRARIELKMAEAVKGFQYGKITLPRAAQATLASLLVQPAAPTAAMRELMNMPELPKA